jgi:hypothetical protein
MKRNNGEESLRRQNAAMKLLESELQSLRVDLRQTARTYIARLEIQLAESAAMIVSYGKGKRLAPEHLQEIRDLTIMLRTRKLKPEKGRRKDLRKIESLIGDLHSAMHPGP